MTPRLRSGQWLIPVTAALAVLALTGGLWAVLSHGGGTRPAGFSGFAGTAPSAPGSPPASATPSPGSKSWIAHRVRIDSYYASDARHLAINYTTGVPACYGHIRTPRVQESRTAVTVTLVRSLPKVPREVACIDMALVKSVRITLAAPLGDRVVRDGASGSVVRPGSAPNYPGQLK
jgi:hypothetical protein